MKNKKLVIIDGNAFLHRAWHAIPRLTTKEGLVVNAIYGWLVMFFNMCKDLKPTHIAVTFDLEGGTFRDEIYEDYKANREKQEDALYEQLPYLKDIVRAFDIPVYEAEGFEADDVIGTICKHKDVDNNKVDTIIATGDLDTLQLVDDNTFVYTLKRGISDTVMYKVKDVIEKYNGLRPDQMVDYKGLRGDPSDNIPGVRGIGEKGAITLLNEFGTLDGIYATIEKSPELFLEKGIKQRVVDLLIEQREEALMSKKLATIRDDAPINFSLSDTKVSAYDRQKVVDYLQDLEFKSLLAKLPVFVKKDVAPVGQPSLFSQEKESEHIEYTEGYNLIDTIEGLHSCLSDIGKYEIVAIDTETTGLDSLNDDLLGISLCGEDGKAYYIAYTEKFKAPLHTFFENNSIKWVGHNIKFDMQVLHRYGFIVQPYFDTMLAAYVLNPGNRSIGLDSVVFREIGHEMIPIEQLIGKRGKNQKTLKDVPLVDVSEYACEDADYTFRLYDILKQQLVDEGMSDVVFSLEVPLVAVLSSMEEYGVLLDVDFLKTLSKKLTQELEEVDKDIYKHVGRDFNINSPTQLQEALFDDLKISSDGLKKTKTGISTNASQLEKIMDVHPVIELIMKHRELAKLISTYVDALPTLTDEHNRIHTSFNQTIAATGRLSSSNPNLQNIPIRTELGKEIRKAFVAPQNYSIVAADYSQIELRIVASLSNDTQMINAFKAEEDIHARTAALIFDVDIDKVTKEQRYQAKSINFGVIYGLGSVGLARQTGLSRQEAKAFIDNYFKAFSGIKKYIDEMIEKARTDGYVETLFGRRRYLPDIHSSAPQVKAAAERMAINAPAQGTQADIIKKAMINIHNRDKKLFPEVKMILQVHDELVFEVPVQDLKEFGAYVKEEMSSICELKVPIITDVEYGSNWGDLKQL